MPGERSSICTAVNLFKAENAQNYHRTFGSKLQPGDDLKELRVSLSGLMLPHVTISKDRIDDSVAEDVAIGDRAVSLSAKVITPFSGKNGCGIQPNLLTLWHLRRSDCGNKAQDYSILTLVQYLGI